MEETSVCERHMIGCLSHTSSWGPGLQPRHVAWWGIEPGTFSSAGWCSIHWVTPARLWYSLGMLQIFLWHCFPGIPDFGKTAFLFSFSSRYFEISSLAHVVFRCVYCLILKCLENFQVSLLLISSLIPLWISFEIQASVWSESRQWIISTLLNLLRYV